MKQISPVGIEVTGIKQVCIVTEDLLTTVDSFWKIFGIGPWALFTFGSPTLHDRKCYGKPAWGWEIGALIQVGPIELEMFKTVEGVSVYQDWINQRGAGLHHVKFVTSDMDVDRTSQWIHEQGFQDVLSGRTGPPEFKGQFCYFDTTQFLHAIWETSNAPYPRILPTDAVLYPEAAKEKPAKSGVKEINQIGLVVKDVQEAAANYSRILGIGPWVYYDYVSPFIYDRKYRGKSVEAKERTARAMIGDVELELCQPVDGDSIYQDFLSKHGEGLHHLQLSVDDVEETVGVLSAQGFPSLQSGRISSANGEGVFHFIDIQPLHCIWKITNNARGLSGAPLRYT